MQVSKQTFCFTSDLDGASPEVLRTIHDIYYKHRVPNTVFIGLDDADFMRIWHDPAKGRSVRFETAIHPRFCTTADYTYTLSKTHAHLLEAVGVRAHGLLTFSNLFEMYERFGLKYDSSYIMHNCTSEPFLIRNNLVEMPIFFEDDVQMALGRPMDIGYLYLHDGIHVFNFHPIHVHNDQEVKSLLLDLIAHAKKHDIRLATCQEIALEVLRKSERIETMIMR